MLSTARFALRRAAASPRAAIPSMQARNSSSNSNSNASKTSSSSKNSPDSTSKGVLAAEAQAEADRALTQHRAEGESIAAAAVSGAPTELTRRPVRIYQVGNQTSRNDIDAV